MKEVSAYPNLSTLEFQGLETENTQLKEELTTVRIKNDSLRDENVSIKKRYQYLYKSKAESNSNVSNGTAVPKKPKVLAPGLYAMTPKCSTPIVIIDPHRIRAGLRDHPPMLATGRYPQWRSRFLRYIDTRPNAIPEHITVETPMNMSPENKAHFESKKEAIHLILTGIGDEIYSTVDACQTAQEMWVKDSAYHKEKMLLCKQAEKGVPLQSEQYDWLEDTDEEIDEQELEAHYSYMAKIQDNKQTEFEKYKAFNDRTVDCSKLKRKLNETLGQLAQKDIEIKEGLKTKAYEISVVKENHDELIKQSLLTKSHYEGLVKQKTKVITDLKLREEHDIDKMLSMEKQLKFLNEIVYKRSQ
nr:hypothetical protein [Tanacetum cinerariifolium]